MWPNAGCEYCRGNHCTGASFPESCCNCSPRWRVASRGSIPGTEARPLGCFAGNGKERKYYMKQMSKIVAGAALDACWPSQRSAHPPRSSAKTKSAGIHTKLTTIHHRRGSSCTRTIGTGVRRSASSSASTKAMAAGLVVAAPRGNNRCASCAREAAGEGGLFHSRPCSYTSGTP